MADVRIELEGYSREDVEAIVTDMIATTRRAVELTAIEAWGQVKRESPVDQGNLASRWDLTQKGEMEWSVYTNVAYALAVHEGRDPGPAPWGPIELWAKRKGLPPGPVYGKIVYHGTEPNRFVDRAVDSTYDRVDEFITRAIREVYQQNEG